MTPAKSTGPASKPAHCRPDEHKTAILTPRQVQILRMIRDYRNNHGCSPTLQELAGSLDLSKVTIFEHVESLVKKGILRREANKARSLMVSESVRLSGDARLSTPAPASPAGRHPDHQTGPGQYPLAGTIAAGLPLEALETPDTIDLTSLFETREGTFALNVRGDSMIDDHICDGDVVLVRPCHEVRNGEIAVAILNNGEATLKRYYREKNRIRLQPANPDFAPIYTDKVTIQGVVVGIIRRFPG